MPLSVLEFLKWSGLIISPIMTGLYFVTNISNLSYKIRRWRLGGRFIRLFYTAPNGKVFTSVVHIGNDYSDKILEFNNKLFLYDKDRVMMMPKKCGIMSGEPFLWYTFDNIAPREMRSMKDSREFDSIMEDIIEVRDKVKNMTKNGVKIDPEIHVPHDLIRNYNVKVPEEFYKVIKTKVFSDFVQPENNGILGKKGGMFLGILLVVIILYVVAKKMGWLA